MDEMVLLPAEGVEEDQTLGEEMPWLNRAKRGGIRGWLSTIGMAMVAPFKLMRLTPVAGSVGSAWWFAIFTNVLVALVALLPFWFLTLFMGATGGFPGGFAMVGGCGCTAVSYIVAVVVLIFLWGLTAHGLLQVTGPTQGRLGRTYHAICYSAGANAASAIPCLGIYFGWSWWVISAVLMIKEGQKVSGGRAALAALTLPCSLIVIVIGFYALFMYSMLSGVGPFGGLAGGFKIQETQTVVTSLHLYADEHNGELPKHAIQLVEHEYLATADLVSLESDSIESNTPIFGRNLGQFEQLSPTAQKWAVQALVSALGANIIAHRLGDFVFTYHGIELKSADPQLWLVIWSPDPHQISTPRVHPLIPVGLADGRTQALPQRRFAELLAEQNNLRSKYDLPPLPDPAKVTHAVAARK
jgi:hypothetical protein